MERLPLSAISSKARLESGIAFDGNSTLPELFERQVHHAPEAVAVTFEQESLTYRKLDARAEGLANVLRRLGVGPEAIVGLCMDRSIDLIVSIVAVLKAGGAYLPIDPTCPKERFAFMLEDSNAQVLLTQTSLSTHFPPTQAKVVCVDSRGTDHPSCVSFPDHLETKPDTDHLAYVIYTSGTTGKPKGALVTHRNVVRLFSATEPWFRFNAQDVWTLFHSYTFDFSVWEIWGALLFGGRLVIVPYYVSRSPDAFYRLLAKEGITVLNQTPSAFQQLLHAQETAGPEELSLRWVVFGGEALKMKGLSSWYDRHSDERPRLVNMYGITETTVHVTYRPLSRDDLRSGSVIGKAIDDLQLYILDEHGQPISTGQAGELYVGGAGLARGYLNCPDLTAERFVPHPFSKDPGARLYRTGDLARYLQNGDIEYLSRADYQVKIRGFRVELREIESVLSQHPSVRDCIIMVREGPSDEKRLVAYLISNQTTALSISDLRNFMREKLPDYMLPSAFVILDCFPLTNNGKVDRQALPDISGIRPNLRDAYLAPGNELERALTAVWQEALQIKGIGVEDNFFDLGGQSLQLVRVHEELRKVIDKHLAITTLFQYPTIRLLAKHLNQESGNAGTVARIQNRARRQKEAIVPPRRRHPGNKSSRD